MADRRRVILDAGVWVSAAIAADTDIGLFGNGSPMIRAT